MPSVFPPLFAYCNQQCLHKRIGLWSANSRSGHVKCWRNAESATKQRSRHQAKTAFTGSQPGRSRLPRLERAIRRKGGQQVAVRVVRQPDGVLLSNLAGVGRVEQMSRNSRAWVCWLGGEWLALAERCGHVQANQQPLSHCSPRPSQLTPSPLSKMLTQAEPAQPPPPCRPPPTCMRCSSLPDAREKQ